MAHPEKDVALAGAAGNSSSSRFSGERRSAAGKDFEPEQGGQQTSAGQTGTGYPGPEVEQGKPFEPEEGGEQTPAAKTGTGYPGPEVEEKEGY